MKTNPLALVGLLIGWAAVVALLGFFPVFAALPSFVVPALVAALSLSFSVAVARVPAFKETVDAWSVRGIVAAHLGRFLGFYFLWLYTQGRLPAEFAHRAGWGDVATAAGAGLLLLMKEGPGFYRVLLGWNLFGALDLFVAVGTAGWLNFTRPGSVNEMIQFPLVFVPLFLVPVLLASHIYLLRQQVAGLLSKRDKIVPA